MLVLSTQWSNFSKDNWGRNIKTLWNSRCQNKVSPQKKINTKTTSSDPVILAQPSSPVNCSLISQLSMVEQSALKQHLKITCSPMCSCVLQESLNSKPRYTMEKFQSIWPRGTQHINIGQWALRRKLITYNSHNHMKDEACSSSRPNISAQKLICWVD